MAETSRRKKEKGPELIYEPDDDSDNENFDFSFLDFSPETFKPTNGMCEDPFLNMLCEDNMFKHTYFEGEDDLAVEDEEEAGDEQVEDIELDEGAEYRVHDPNVKWNKMKPTVGELYESPAQLRFALTNYAVANGYQLWIKKSDNSRMIVTCGRGKPKKPCPFRLYASWKFNDRTFQIKSMVETHLCARNYKFGSLVSLNWLAKHYLKVVMRKPKMTLNEMKDDVLRKFSVVVSRGQCHRARVRAREMIEGKLEDHYARVWDYADEVLRSNPGSTCKVGVTVNPDGRNYFKRFYVCFKALRDAWNSGCRKVVGLDGCFLKGQIKGELLTAIGRDANNHVFPIAWAVVDVENKDNWSWFVELLVDDLGVEAGRGMVVVSDQHKGLLEAVRTLLPQAEHRACARHICANFRKIHTGKELENMFWAAATSTVVGDFEARMQEIKAVTQKGYDWLMAHNPQSWCRAYFSQGYACEAVENGVSECFNAIIVYIRKKPLLTMLEELRIYVMARFFHMAETASKWEGQICPKIIEKMDEFGVGMSHWSVIPSGGAVFETRNGCSAYKVDLDAHICTCRLWEISGIPCIHAQAAINFKNEDPKDYISIWFSKEKFLRTYRDNISPMNGIFVRC